MKNTNTSIGVAMRRVKRILDDADIVMVGFSGGKDSALCAELMIKEVKERRERVRNNINKNGESVVDPLDEKWINKKIFINSMHCEWEYSDTIDYCQRFYDRYKDYINVFNKHLQLGWQSGVSFGKSRLISWDPAHKDEWIQKMMENPITNDNIRHSNLVDIDNLDEDIKNKRIREEDFIERDGKILVSNFGFGSKDLRNGFTAWTYEGQDEDQEQRTFSEWVIKQNPGKKIYSIIGLRANESFDRTKAMYRVDKKIGTYSKIKTKDGEISVASPIYDMSTSDVFRTFTYFNWDLNEAYSKMYEAGVSEKNMRVGSLLNFCATRNIGQVKFIEPQIYNKISKRFTGVELMSNFGNKGYFNITRPNEEISWRDYCLHMLATTPEPQRSNWRRRVVTLDLTCKYSTVSCPKKTIEAFNKLVKVDKNVQFEKNREVWEERDLLIHGQLKSGKYVISLKRMPNESFEQELINCIPEESKNFKEDIHSTRNWKEICCAILKNDNILKYCGFGRSYSQRNFAKKNKRI